MRAAARGSAVHKPSHIHKQLTPHVIAAAAAAARIVPYASLTLAACRSSCLLLWFSTLRRKGMAERCRGCRFAGDESCLSTVLTCVLSAKEQTMSSGVQCTDECVTKFNELKLKVVAAP
jgi:hypothetical protein